MHGPSARGPGWSSTLPEVSWHGCSKGEVFLCTVGLLHTLPAPRTRTAHRYCMYITTYIQKHIRPGPSRCLSDAASQFVLVQFSFFSALLGHLAFSTSPSCCLCEPVAICGSSSGAVEPLRYELQVFELQVQARAVNGR